MSYLDLPPDENTLAFGQAQHAAAAGPVRVLPTLVARGLVGLATPAGMEIWGVPDPGSLAAALGVGGVERVDTGDGFAECGYLDVEHGRVVIRPRRPNSGPTRNFAVTPGWDGERPELDPWAAWQLTRAVHDAVYRREPMLLHQPGYGTSAIELAVRTDGEGPVRGIAVSASPPQLARRWPSASVGFRRTVGDAPLREAKLPLAASAIPVVVQHLIDAFAESGLRACEFMLAYRTP